MTKKDTAKPSIHIIQFPSKRWGFVGVIPADLGERVKGDILDIMAGRTDVTGHVIKFPVFDNPEDAQRHVEDHNYTATIHRS